MIWLRLLPLSPRVCNAREVNALEAILPPGSAKGPCYAPHTVSSKRGSRALSLPQHLKSVQALIPASSSAFFFADWLLLVACSSTQSRLPLNPPYYKKHFRDLSRFLQWNCFFYFNVKEALGTWALPTVKDRHSFVQPLCRPHLYDGSFVTCCHLQQFFIAKSNTQTHQPHSQKSSTIGCKGSSSPALPVAA